MAAGSELSFLDYRGCRLAYRLDGSGPPLVMIQGVGAQGTSPNPQIEILSRHYTCLTFDSRGIGASVPAAGALTVELMAKDTLALLNHLGWESAHMVGHSLGGLIAMEIGLTARDRVRSLTLLCSFASGAAAVRPGAKLLWIVARIRLGSRRVRRRAFMELVLSKAEIAGDSNRIQARLARVLGHDLADIPAIAGKQVGAMRKFDVTPRLGALAGIPTLVIAGTEDLIATPAGGKVIAAGVPGARYLEFAGTAHALPIFHSEECARETLSHLCHAESSRRQALR